jgi:hypothetical protein
MSFNPNQDGINDNTEGSALRETPTEGVHYLAEPPVLYVLMAVHVVEQHSVSY